MLRDILVDKKQTTTRVACNPPTRTGIKTPEMKWLDDGRDKGETITSQLDLFVGKHAW